MTPREFSIAVVKQLNAAGFTAYWAGGCVRDLLLGKEPHDFDVATNAHPEQVRELFGPRRTLAVGESFGVIIVLGPREAGQIEVATFRREGDYLDGRRPSNVEYCSAEEDSKRRDFTINGMFYDPLEGQVHDFVGGQIDLKNRLVRAIGTPNDRMEEDKLRLLRAVRFTAALDFELDPQTAIAIQKMASQIIVVSAERIAQELRKMLLHSQRARAVSLCEELHLLSVILPEVVEHSLQLSAEHWHRRLCLLQELSALNFELPFAALLRDVPAPAAAAAAQRTGSHVGTVRGICTRLKLSNAETEKINWLVQHRGALDSFLEMSLAEQKKLVIAEHFLDLLHLEETVAQIDQQPQAPFIAIADFLQQRSQENLNPAELLNGRTLIDLGFRPGPQFQVWLNHVRDAQLNEQISTQEEAIELIQRLGSLSD